MKTPVLTAVLILSISTAVVGAEYHVDRSAENLVRFISDAPLEDFDGVTDRIDGYVYWEGDNLPDEGGAPENGELYLEVKLATLDTGIGLRNRHMRENYLETDKYPFATYKAHLIDVKRISDTSYIAVADGKILIHGVQNPLKATTTIMPSSTGFRVQCNFEVNLKDFNIKIPKFMFLKLGEVIRLQLDFHLIEFDDDK